MRHYLDGVDQGNSPVLKFRHWRDRYIGNGGRLDEEIPTLQGPELLLRQDVWKLLKKKLGPQLKYVQQRIGRSKEEPEDDDS